MASGEAPTISILISTALEESTRVVGGAQGWRYYVDNALTPPEATFYANSDTGTIAENDF